MKLEAVMVTDVGVVRDHNEDSAHVDPAQRFFIVADGMGGHAAGEVASAMAVETVQKTLEGATSIIEGFAARPTDNARRALVQLLQSAVLAAHQAVYQRGNRESDKQGMGTTLDVLLIAGQEAFVAHVGDSRTYLIRDGKAAQLTTDHTVAEVLVIEGKLTIEEALVSPYRTVLVNAIGVAADVGVEMAHLQLKKGDRLLLCSDGLHDYFLAEQEIADTLSDEDSDRDGRVSLGGMVETAKERGGHDNITGVVVTVVDLGEAVPALVEHDQTLPVEVPTTPSSWTDDERTENISPKDLDRWSAPAVPGAKAGGAPDDGMRTTQPMAAVQLAEAASFAVTGTEATDPGINIAAIDKVLEKSRTGSEAATPAAAAKAALGRAATDPPPVDEDATVDQRAVADAPERKDGKAARAGKGSGAKAKAKDPEPADRPDQDPGTDPGTAETGPVARVDADKVG